MDWEKVNQEWFKSLFYNAKEGNEWCESFKLLFPKYQINTPQRVAAFISQCGIETAGWTKFEENMNYSATRMMQVWPKTFNKALAEKCDHNPELVANYAYANRMGNGAPESGEGWRYRGRGPLHLTGKYNYIKFAQDTNQTAVINNPDLLNQSKDVMLSSALWFWKTNKVNEIADTYDIKRLTKVINGGSWALKERTDLFDRVLAGIS